jgi:hypothetical protein
MRPRARRQIEHGAGKKRVRRTIGREDQADRLERFTDNQRHALLGRLQKEFTMDGRRKTGDNNGRHVLQRELALNSIRRFACQLAVLATQRALRRVYADNMVRHASLSAQGNAVLTGRRNYLISRGRRTSGNACQWSFKNFQAVLQQCGNADIDFVSFGLVFESHNIRRANIQRHA